MLVSLASYAVKGVLQGALVAATLLCLSLLVPPLICLSGAYIALYGLRKEWRKSLVMMGVALVAASVFCQFILDSWKIAPILVAAFWLPAYLLALVLRKTTALASSLLLAASLALLGLSAMYLVLPDPVAYCLRLLQEMNVGAIWAEQFTLSNVDTDAFLVEVARLMPASIAVYWMLSAICSLFLGRSWQAKLFNPGGFQAEYHQLRLGRYAAVVAIALSVFGLLLDNSYALGLFAIAAMLYFFQGSAVLHAVVKLRAMSVIWLAVLYLLCITLPQLALLLCAVGWLDTWWDIRRRLQTKISAS